MADIDDVLDRVRPARREVPVCLDGTLSARLDALQERWRAAVRYDLDRNEQATAPAIADEITALQDEANTATVSFVIEAMGATAWRRLVAEHPPPDDDLDGWRWHPETFPPAAVAACCIKPKMSEDAAAALADRLSDGQWGKLFTATMAVNVGDDLPNFDGGSGARPTFVPKSPTAPPEESLTASSSASAASPDPESPSGPSATDS